MSQQQQQTITVKTELRITRAELMSVLRDHYEFLWHFAKKMGKCGRCSAKQPGKDSYRIMINGYGDFILYNGCGSCSYPLRSYVDLSQDKALRQGLRHLWLTKIN